MGGYSRFSNSVNERRALREASTAALFATRSDLRKRREGEAPSRRVFLAKLLLGWDLLRQADAPNTQTVHSGGYPRRTWRKWREDHFEATFRFRKEDMPRLMAALDLPQEFVTSEGAKFTADEAMTILLLKLTTPTTLHAIHVATGRRPGHTSGLLKLLFKWIDDKWSLRLLGSDLERWTSHFPEWADAIFEKTGRRGLDGCIGFIDGTLRGIARPNHDEDVMFNGALLPCLVFAPPPTDPFRRAHARVGHHWAHGLVYQAWVAPNGLCIDLAGPVRGRRHDTHLLRKSKLLVRLKAACAAAGYVDGTYCLYADAGYHISPFLIAAFRRAAGAMPAAKAALNRVMSGVRIAVEWGFGRVTNLFGALDYTRRQQVNRTPVGLMYRTAVILANAHCCLYGNQTTQAFDVAPPTLEEYFQGAPQQPGGWAQADDSDMSF
jgi:hypothetical protein